jgi:hypothetical protein
MPAPACANRRRRLISGSSRFIFSSSWSRIPDPVKDAVLVVPDQQRAVRHHRTTGQPPEVRVLPVLLRQPAGDERLDPFRPPRLIERDPGDLIPRRRQAVPRTAHRHECVTPVLGRELIAGVEGHLERGAVRGVLQHRGAARLCPRSIGERLGRTVGRVGLAVLVDVRPAVPAARLDPVQFLPLLVVAKPVDAMVEPPEVPGFRVPTEADGIAEAARVDGAARAIGPHAQYGRVLLTGLVAGVAGGADGDVQPAVGPERERTVRVLTGLRQVIHQDAQRAERAVRPTVGHEDLVDRHEVEAVAPQGEPMRHRAPGDYTLGVRAAVAILVAEHDHVAWLTLRDVHRAVGSHRYHPRVLHALGPFRDGEAWRRLQRRDARGGRRQWGRAVDVGTHLPGDRRLLLHVPLGRQQARPDGAPHPDGGETEGGRRCFCASCVPVTI